MRKIITLVIFLVFFILPIASAETKFKAQVDKLKLSTDEALTYKVSVVSSEKNLPVPDFPIGEGFNILSRFQNSQVSISQGQLKVLANYVFILQPNKSGKLKIAPSTIKINNQIFTTDSFEVEVKQGKIKPQPKEPLPHQEGQPEVTL